MPPRVPALAQSESKTKFFDRIGLNKDDPADKQLYSLMKAEAAAGRKNLIESHVSLVFMHRNILAPLIVSRNESINETAIHREILNIYAKACRQTKAVYDLGRDTDGVEEENWIVRWLLWHAFRYRDQRNNRKARPTSHAYDSAEEDLVPTQSRMGDSSASNMSSDSSGTPAARSEQRGSSYGRYWDPVRNQWQGP